MEDIVATRFISEINTGLSKPVILGASDGNNYVVKFRDDLVTNKVLINDLICCRLAKLFDLPVAEARTIFIGESLINIEPYLSNRKIKDGKHFASLHYKNTYTFIGENSLKGISNIDKIPDIIAFDLWVGNDDRADNEGNLLLRTSINNDNLLIIDYGNSFHGPDWIEYDLKCNDILVPPFDGKVYNVLKKYVNGSNPFQEICKKIKSITYDEITSCVADIPDSWNLNEDNKKNICDFLFNRKEKLEDILEYLKSKNEFYNWRR